MNNPELWRQLLQQAPKGSVLMGGAVVDFMCGIQPKDYDIFYRYHPGMPEVSVNWMFVEMDYNDPVQLKQHNADYQQLNNGQPNPIGAVYNYKVPSVEGVLDVQMIGVQYQDPKDHFQNFDHTLTLGSYSETGMFVHEKVFESLATKTITYIGKDNPKAKMRSRNRALEKASRIDPNGWMNWNTPNFE